MLPFIDLKSQYAALKDSIDQRIHKVLDHGQFILGPEVTECEEALAKYTGCKKALTCGSGTDALILALMALEVGPGDEVIVPGFSFIASAEVILLVGAKPVFVDIQKETYNVDPQKVSEAITNNTKAIITVGLYGQPADMDEINAIAAEKNVSVIEDAAQSFGAEYKGKRSGGLAKIGCTSFFPAKPLGCYGDGGATFTDDEALFAKMKSLRMHGQSETDRYHHVNIGTNARMDTLQCAVILSKLERFDWEVAQRHRIGQRYTEAFQALDGKVITPKVCEDRTSVYAQYTLWLEGREELRQHLQKCEIPTAVHYPIPMYKQPAYQHLHEGSLEISDWAAKGVVSLPMHPEMDEKTQDKIIDAVNSFF